MALGYTIASILKRSSHVFSDERVSVKTDWLEQLNRKYVQVYFSWFIYLFSYFIMSVSFNFRFKTIMHFFPLFFFFEWKCNHVHSMKPLAFDKGQLTITEPSSKMFGAF